VSVARPEAAPTAPPVAPALSIVPDSTGPIVPDSTGLIVQDGTGLIVQDGTGLIVQDGTGPVDGGPPWLVREVELTDPLPDLAKQLRDRSRMTARLLVRLDTEPLGQLTFPVTPASTAADLAARIAGEFAGPLAARGVSVVPATEPVAIPGGISPYRRSRARLLASAARTTAVVCTHDRPEGLRRVLRSLLGQQFPDFEVLVVDNAPSDARARQVVDEAARRGPVRYVCEPRPGLSWARNRAIEESAGEVLAWIDDDEVADPWWLAELARGLAAAPSVDAVSGVMVAAEMRTQAQLWFEEFGGHSKGRGFLPVVFTGSQGQSPLFPLPPFGTGGNMAFRRAALERIGGFDPALGAGSPCRGCEDTLAFSQVLLYGGTVAYQPTALVRHFHREDLAGLRDQLVGYGLGLGAFYASVLRERPTRLLRLAALAPRAVREVVLGGGEREATLGPEFPRDLLAENRRAMLAGPGTYLRARRAVRRELRAIRRESRTVGTGPQDL